MKARWKFAIASALTVPLSLGMAAPAFAQSDADKAVVDLGIQVNLLWVIIGAAMVVFMQAGFALVETGFCRAKHASHVVSTNFAIFGLGFVGFFLIGYPLMFGGYRLESLGITTPVGTNLLGSGNWVFLWQGGWAGSGEAFYTAGTMGFFLYMVAFMDTTATIPTGSMAERWHWKAFVGWGLFCGAIYYPLFGAWTWGGGWLASLGRSAELGLGYVDFAGSGVVHATGGAAALAGAIALGPRLGKYDKDGKPRVLAGHHIPMAMLGTFILLFGWFGFNAASTFAVTDVRFAVVAFNTAAAAAFGSVAAMAYMMLKGEKPDPAMMANGMLIGLVAITAPCAFVQPWAAMVIGTLAGLIVIPVARFIEARGIDDPVGAVTVHGVGGAFGVLAVGLFADGQYGAGVNGTTWTKEGVTGLFYDVSLGGKQLAVQAIAVVVIFTVMFGIAYAFFKIQEALLKNGIRSSEADEIEGLDVAEMGVFAYPHFTPSGEEELAEAHFPSKS